MRRFKFRLPTHKNRIKFYFSNSFGYHQQADSKKGNGPINLASLNIERCILETNNYYKEKKHDEFLTSLKQLKISCLKLENEMEINGKMWNYVIQHFCKSELYHQDALYWFNRIRRMVSFNSYTLSAIFKVYSKIGNIEICEEILQELEKQEKSNIFLYIDYMNSIMDNSNNLEMEFTILERLKKYKIEPNFGIFIPLLKHATKLNNYNIGMKIYEAIKQSKLHSPQLTVNIVNFALKLKRSDIALNELNDFKKVDKMNIIMYTCLIQTFIQMDEIKQVFEILNEMNRSNIHLDSTLFTIILTEFANRGLYEQGKLIIEISKKNLKEFSIELNNTIINFYTKCGYANKAIEEFNIMKRKGKLSIVSFNCLIQAFILKNELNNAILQLDEMKMLMIHPNVTTFVILLNGCANLKVYEQGLLIIEIAEKNLKEFSIELNNTIINFYTKCGHPDKAIEEFNLKKNQIVSVVSYTFLIQAFMEKNEIKKVFEILNEMNQSNIHPDSTLFTIILTEFANRGLYEQGQLIIGIARKTLKDITIGFSTAIINFYTKCGYPDKAIEEFNIMKRKGKLSIVSFNCLIQAFILKNELNNAILILNELKEQGVVADATTFIILLNACTNLKRYEQGLSIIEIARKNLKEFSIELNNTIINFYTKCGHPNKAIKECKRLGEITDIVTWTCLIQAHIKLSGNEFDTKHGLNKAFEIYQELKHKISPNTILYCILLSACGEYVAIDIGMKIIQDIKLRVMDTTEEITSIMVYFYSRIGQEEKAQELFDNLVNRITNENKQLSIITYNNMLSCYAQHGNGSQAMKLYKEMIEKNVKLDEISFIVLLNCYSHCGMVDQAIEFYNDMEEKHNFKTNITIDCVMVDVFARSGRFKQAEELINNRNDIQLWSALMSGCRKFNDIEMGEKVFKKITEIDETNTAAYILLSHIYKYHNMNDKANVIRNLMKEKEIKKIPGIVCREEDGQVYKFISGATNYDRFEEVEKMRDEIYRKIIHAGFKPDTRWATHVKSITEQEKIDSLSRHAEKTAMAHAFVLNPNRKSIVLTKNLRVCNDCHNATAFISKVMNVEIIVRDAYRYHRFKNGKCSCGDYW